VQRLLSIVLLGLCVGMPTLRVLAADNELNKLAPADRAVVQKVLAIDAKLSWSQYMEHVDYIDFKPRVATTAIVALLPHLPALTVISLGGHRFHSTGKGQVDLAPLARCTALRQLNLEVAENHTVESWQSLPVLERVTTLQLYDGANGRCEIVRRFPQASRMIFTTNHRQQFNVEQFGKLQQLDYLQLHLGTSSWDGEGLSQLKSCSRLTQLAIGGAGLTDVALREISEIPTLKELTLISGTFTRAGFEALTTLESFRCQGRWLTDEMLSGLVNCRHLKTLEVSAVNGSCFAVFAKLPLEEIQCPELTLENIHLLKPCKTLKRLQTIVLTKDERETQQVVWRAIGQKASLKQIWGGNKGDDPKSGK
jgi:hypothetical protein